MPETEAPVAPSTTPSTNVSAPPASPASPAASPGGQGDALDAAIARAQGEMAKPASAGTATQPAGGEGAAQPRELDPMIALVAERHAGMSKERITGLVSAMGVEAAEEVLGQFVRGMSGITQLASHAGRGQPEPTPAAQPAAPATNTQAQATAGNVSVEGFVLPSEADIRERYGESAVKDILEPMRALHKMVERAEQTYVAHQQREYVRAALDFFDNAPTQYTSVFGKGQFNQLTPAQQQNRLETASFAEALMRSGVPFDVAFATAAHQKRAPIDAMNARQAVEQQVIKRASGVSISPNGMATAGIVDTSKGRSESAAKAAMTEVARQHGVELTD